MNRLDDIVVGRRSQFGSFLNNLRIAIPTRWDHVIFWVVSLILLIAIGMANRSSMLDNENYLNYFRETDLNWFLNFFSLAKDNITLLFAFFTEEFLWRTWALALGLLFSEDQAVLITVLSLNFLVILALFKISRPLFGLLLWVLIPQALSTVGTFQIRQGFAFSIMLYMILSLRRPIVGCFIASAIHTTFVIPLVYILIFKALKGPVTRLLVLYLFVSLLLTIAGNQLFHDYGGRRAEQYFIEEGASSINYVFGALICSVSSLLHLFQSKKKMTPTMELAIIHIGCIIFIVLSWFIFPIGTSRNGYFAFLFLIVTIPELHTRNHFAWYFWLLTLTYLVYFIIKTYFVDGSYNEILQGW